MDIDHIQVVHQPAEHRFEALIDGKLCKLDYLQNGNQFVITHVGVHPSLRGQGIAAKIVETALKYARENSLRVIPMCSYAAAYIRRHPEYADLTKSV
ncbi:MAG: GNAT family N-acetyltransferase [Chloroflexota bacterium]|nr:N-acetyltransferase [Chloroflexota bacterium]MBI5704835.1 N-acetyltransferase [Chloroflexota bacterium]